MKFKKIRIKELIDFVESDFYKQSDFLPISKLRAVSQVQNPRADVDDIALILALDDTGKIAGFVGALPEKILSLPDLKTAWNSCWYVPEGNGKYAMPLFYQFMAAYNGNVMMRDMTKHTKSLLLQTGRFSVAKELKGMRAYLSLNLSDQLPKRFSFFKHLKFLLRLFDFFLDNIIRIRGKLKPDRQHNLTAVYPELLDNETDKFIRKHNCSDLIQRNAKELNWIKQNSWITANPTENQISVQKKYYFSLIKKQFESKFVKLYNKDELIAVLYLTVINGELRVPYLFTDAEYLRKVSYFITEYMTKNKCKTFMTFNSYLVDIFSHKRAFFIAKRKFNKEFVVSKSLKKNIPEHLNFQDGEGDFVFV